jgi:radical SAM superfamily enzyme YgiQ (UPF0313 family)
MQSRRPIVLVFPDGNVTFFGLKGGEAFKKMYRLPPQGILYISSALEAAGYPTVIVNEEAQPRLLERLDWLRSLDPLFVGIHTNILNEPLVCDMIRTLRAETAVPVVTGGPGCFRPEPFLRAGADLMVEGEGEATVVEVARHYEGLLELEEIEGIFYLKDGEAAHTGKRKQIADLDTIAFPAWLKNPEIDYYSRYSLTVREPYFTVVTNRGCAMRCDYCGSPATWQNAVRRRSVGNVIDELKLLHENFRFRYIDFFDDIFVYGGKWEAELCEAILRLPFKFNWGCIAYPKNIDLELLKLMHRAGCDTLKIGVQSTSAEELRAIHRHPNTVERGYELIHNARKLGMMTSIDFIFGLPGSTRESMQATAEWMFAADPTIIKIAELEFYPGSPLYERRHEKMTDVPLEWMEELHRKTVRRFFARPRKLYEIARLMLRNPSTLRHALRYADFMVRHVMLGAGENQVELAANSAEGVATGGRTLETAGPRWLLNAGRRSPTGTCNT